MIAEETPSAREQSLAWSDSPEWPEALSRAESRYLLKWARSQGRLWYHKRATWVGLPGEDFKRKRLPWFGNDEYGRKTIVLPIPFHGNLVWAFWTWKGKDDDHVRKETHNDEISQATRPKVFEDTFILVGEFPFVDVNHNLDDCDLRWTMHAEGDPEELIKCAVYPLDWQTLRMYPVYETETTVTVRVEVGEVGTGRRHLLQQWPDSMA